jgi:hypothetical protein
MKPSRWQNKFGVGHGMLQNISGNVYQHVALHEQILHYDRVH